MPKYVVYGEASFSTTNRRNTARTQVSNYAATNGFTAEAYDVYPAGATDATIGGNPGFRFAYTTPSIATAEAADNAANQALQSSQVIDGFTTHQEIYTPSVRK